MSKDMERYEDLFAAGVIQRVTEGGIVWYRCEVGKLRISQVRGQFVVLDGHHGDCGERKTYAAAYRLLARTIVAWLS